MSAHRRAAASPVTWVLALVLLAAIDAAITRTDLLWGPTAFENSGGVRTVFPQTYQVMRKIYAAGDGAEKRIALLGNSRIVLAIKEGQLERALAEVSTDEVRALNLGIFGSFMGDTEVLARHLAALDPDLVVLAVGAADLIRDPTNPDGGGPMRLLRIGWRDGPLETSSFVDRLDRWTRTVWRLYRFREFAREAILDRLLGRPDPGAPPEELASRLALFEQLYAERAPAVEDAYQRWLGDRGLGAYAAYLEVASPGHLSRGRQRARWTRELTADTESVVVLDRVVRDLADAGRPTVLLLMPENPLLAEDADGEFHRPGLADRGAVLVREIAARHGVAVIDARGWLPAECFLDFDHPIFDLDRFADPLARELGAHLGPHSEEEEQAGAI